MPVSKRGAMLLSCAFPLLMAFPSGPLAGDRADDRRVLFTVLVDTVRESRIDSRVVGTGTVAAWRELPISSEANGLAIVEILADEGELVRKGQVLARLNQALLLAQLTRNKAAVEEAEASLSNAVSDVTRAHAVASGVMSRQAIELRETLVKVSTARLASARAAVEETTARLAQTEIAAPADGLVARRSAAIGQVVQSGSELFRLIQDGRLEVNALVPETDVSGILTGQSARIIAPAGRASPATVRLVAPVVDEKTRLGTVRLALPAATPLKPGMFVRVEIDAGSTQALTIPLKALVWRAGRAAVFTVGKEGTARLRTITVGRATSSSVEVVQGLTSGERIVVEGAGLVNDGERVRAEFASVLPPARMP